MAFHPSSGKGYPVFSKIPLCPLWDLDGPSHFFHWEEALFITHRVPLWAHFGDEFSIRLSLYTGQY